MKRAYYTHHKTFKAFNEAKSAIEKRAIAMTYFKQDAEIVDAEMKRKLEEELQ